jgi:hypothetical protein
MFIHFFYRIYGVCNIFSLGNFSRSVYCINTRLCCWTNCSVTAFYNMQICERITTHMAISLKSDVAFSLSRKAFLQLPELFNGWFIRQENVMCLQRTRKRKAMFFNFYNLYCRYVFCWQPRCVSNHLHQNKDSILMMQHEIHMKIELQFCSFLLTAIQFLISTNE